jgi:hypothetical protein
MEKITELPNQPGDYREVLKQTQRILAWSTYQESLKDVDQKVLEQFQATITGLRTALWVRSAIYLIQFLIMALILFLSSLRATQVGQNAELLWGIAFGSLILLAILLYRNPLPSMNHIIVDLARIQIILQGYIRQVNQVDVSFKQAILEDKIDLKSLEKSLKQIQVIIDNNIESLLQFLEEMHL